MKKILTLFVALMFIASPVFAASDTEQDYEIGQNFSIGGGTVIDKMFWASDAVASGQTSKAVTISGITTSSKCQATLNEVATNSISIRAAVATSNTVTVTVSGDPGASNADFSVICVE